MLRTFLYEPYNPLTKGWIFFHQSMIMYLLKLLSINSELYLISIIILEKIQNAIIIFN